MLVGMRAFIQTYKKYPKLLSAVVIGVLLTFLAYEMRIQPARALSAVEIQAQIIKIQKDIADNQSVLEDLESQSLTLENKINEFKAQIESTEKLIELSNLQIEKLTIEIDEAQKELDRQKNILAQALKELYKRGNVTTIELLATSNSYSDFINQQEYLQRVESAIKESAAKVEALKKQLEADKERQVLLKLELEGQRQVLDNQKKEQERLLEETQGQEEKYQEILANLDKQRNAAEAALQAFITAGQFVNLGPIEQGQAIGTVGNTGFSTGPHLHFEIRNPSGGVVDPIPFINNGWSWPTINSVWQIWQGFGNPSPWYVRGWHPGVDTGYAGETVVAMTSGIIIARGCSQDYLGTPAYGYMVMIDHGNGYKSLYAHMLPPSGGVYAHCSTSYGF